MISYCQITKLNVHEITNKIMSMSKSCVGHILHELLNIKNMWDQCVPRLITLNNNRNYPAEGIGCSHSWAEIWNQRRCYRHYSGLLCRPSLNVCLREMKEIGKSLGLAEKNRHFLQFYFVFCLLHNYWTVSPRVSLNKKED